VRQLPTAALLDHREDAPIVLVGEPKRLVGRIRLHNRAPTRVVLREARLCGAPVDHLGKRAAPQEFTIPLTAILAPDQQSAVTVKLSIDPQAPPGEYNADLVVGEHRYPVQLHVAESISLSVAPAQLMVENRPGSRVQKRMFFTNAGNVPLQIGNIGAVVLDDELLACKTIRATLDESADQTKTIDQWVNSYLEQGKTLLKAIGMLWVELEAAPLNLQPGQTAAANLTIRVPDSLDPRTRYRGVAFLYDADIGFTVAPTGAEKRKRRES